MPEQTQIQEDQDILGEQRDEQREERVLGPSWRYTVQRVITFTRHACISTMEKCKDPGLQVPPST